MRKIVILFILCLCSNLYGAYDETVLKDMGTNTPLGTENPGILDDKGRQLSRLLEIQYHERLLTVSGTATSADTYIIGSSSAGILCTLPSASSVANGTTTKLFVIKNRGAGTMTLSPTVDGVGSPTVSQNRAMSLFTDGTSWFEIRSENAGDSATLGGLLPSAYARSGANSDITAITGLTTYLAIGQGGSGTNTAAGAASAFGVGTEDTPTLTGVVATGSSTITTLTSTTGSITNQTTTTGTVTTLYSTTGNITNQTTTTGTITTLYSTTGNVTNLVTTTGTVTTLNSTTSNITTGNITNQVTTTGTVTTLNSTTGNVTNLNTTTGTVTTLNSTTGNITNQVTTTGTITTLNNTNLTTTTGTITTLNNTNLSGGSGTWTGNVQAKTASGFPHLTKIIVSGTEGTGSVTLAAGEGIAYNMATSAGSSTITITGVGTSSAGGWTDTGTQTIGIAGNQVLPHGTVTIDAAYGITGLTDAWIPNTITLDNLTQVTTRSFTNMQGLVSLATQTTGLLSMATQTTGLLSIATQTTNALAWDKLTGTPTDNTFFKENVQTAGKILVGISDTILIPATTTTTLSGTSTTGRIFNAQVISQTTGSTTAFTDSSSSNRAMTPVGNVNLSTTQKKFGSRGGSFDGTGDYITAPDSTDWNFGTGDITWETFFYSTVAVGGASGTRYWSTDESASTGFLLYVDDGAKTFTIATYGGGGTTPTTTGTYTVNTWTHLAFVRVGTSSETKIYIDGVASATGTYSDSSADAGDKFNIGHWDISGVDFNGYMDETRVSNVARYTSNFTVPTSAFTSDANTLLLLHYEAAEVDYFTNRLAYVPPGTTNAFLNIISDGTNSTKVEMILGSETAFGSTTTHILQGITASRTLFGFYDAYCFAESKDIFASGTSVQDEAYAIAKKVSIVKSHPVLPNLKVKVEEAETAAREDYLGLFKKSDIETYKRDRVAEYTTTEAGSISVNWASLGSDAQAYHEIQRKAEFEVLPDLNERIKKKKKSMESDKGITNISIIADDVSTDDLLKGSDNRTASLNNQIGVLFGAFQRQTEEIGSLTAALENQKIAYNEEVDNLYRLINAVIVALLAVGGVSGWSTIRRKRKGT